MFKIYDLIKKEIVRVIVPSLTVFILFVAAVFGFTIPILENNLMNQKKMMLTAMIEVGIELLDHYERQARSGTISTGKAQELAVKIIRELNYGPEGKDYFWINDMRPMMIMHPYRSELDGKDVSDFSDPQGKFLFNEFVKVAEKDGAGFVDYLWQWKDDPRRVEKKISYVKLFKPWNWIIGTGVYAGDVHQEISAIMKEMAFISAGILIIIIGISVYIIRNNIKEINRRMAAETEINNYKDHLEDLVKIRTDELQTAMSKVKTLTGFLPICASCKKIRDDQGYWNQIEQYIRDHSEAEFSHGICPDCAEKLYPELYKRTR